MTCNWKQKKNELADSFVHQNSLMAHLGASDPTAGSLKTGWYSQHAQRQLTVEWYS